MKKFQTILSSKLPKDQEQPERVKLWIVSRSTSLVRLSFLLLYSLLVFLKFFTKLVSLLLKNYRCSYYPVIINTFYGHVLFTLPHNYLL